MAGARHLPEFSALLERRGHFHNGLLRQELIGLGRALVSPPLTSGRPCWSVAICRTLYGCHPTDCPVYDYDFITIINYVHSAVAQKLYYGFF